VLGEDPGMASSSKRRASARKRSRAGKARVIATKRKDALPRTGSVSAGRRKPVVLPPIDAMTKPPAKVAAARAKKAHGLHPKERTASRKKTTRATGRASAQLDELTAMEIVQALAALEPVTVTALEQVADTIAAVEPPATAYEELTVTAVDAPEVEALGLVETELNMEAFVLAEELPPAGVAEAPALIAPAIEPAMAPALEPVADPVAAVERPATAYEEFTVTAVEAPEVEVVAVVDAELEVEASAIVEELAIEAETAPRIAIGPPPVPEETRAPSLACATVERPAHAPPAPAHESRAVMPAVVPAISRLLSTLSRWTGASTRSDTRR
jgi:ribonuclease E